MHSNKCGRRLALMLPLALGTSMALAQAGTDRLASISVDELKQVYLACDRAASQQILDSGTAAHCSFVGEALQKRAFGGNFDQLLAWWRAEKDGASAKLSQNQ
ncbi:hypothetical protein [Variovorax sp. OV700]|uniref:hypothetical protein n=1 Tax=Variovorax sp. OV700 TaxID=1882826 RepID=UPI00088F4B4B|nr:hypothetical protein [Variovorax sp. OV700]SDH70100.1 hypothetical protein SAMN05444748_102143 [Variovorax sp. OV700]